MEFKNKLNIMVHMLEISNASLAKISDIHPSLISRFRSGERIPREESPQLLKLSKGIATYIVEKQLHDKFNELLDLSSHLSVTDAVLQYFQKAGDNIRFNRQSSGTIKKEFLFSEKLNTIMDTLGLPNTQLAKHLNVDSSLISRYRNGYRNPQKNSKLMTELSGYLMKKIVTGGHAKQIADLFGVPVENILANDADLIPSFSAWLTEHTEQSSIRGMDDFLSAMGSFAYLHGQIKNNAGIQELMETLDDDAHIYHGIEGLRHAAIRFLTCVSVSKQPRTLKLYSDQNIEWLSEDKEFARQWGALMVMVLLNKNRIQIIHHISRNITEMLTGIEQWMPLYMTGAVEAFYSKKASDTRFSHTLFVAPGLSAINANLVAGTEDNGRYYYFDDSQDIAYFEEQYDHLLELSKPLVKVYNERNISSFMSNIEEVSMMERDTKNVFLSLNVALLPSALLSRILENNGFDPTKIKDLLALHDIYVKRFKQSLCSGTVTDYVPLASLDTGYHNNVQLMLPDFLTDKPVLYGGDDLVEHINCVITCLRENHNYNLVLLRDLPHKNIQISVKEGINVIVNKIDTPSAAFWFGHPLICDAFWEYLATIERRSGVSTSDKKELIKILTKYV